MDLKSIDLGCNRFRWYSMALQPYLVGGLDVVCSWSESWVSRRLRWVSEVPAGLQEQVRSGAVSAHAAMKYLAPMARAVPEDRARLAAAIGRLRLQQPTGRRAVRGFKPE